jgi:uncharacterized protein YdeI (YjbR/CyaY-like superfamily)
MEIRNLLHNIKGRKELRDWLTAHSKKETECWIPCASKAAAGKLAYLDIVEEALCFGWIDSTRKKMTDEQVVQRISPRRKNGNWTELNKERVRRLEKLGLMTDEGRKCLPDMSEKSFKLNPRVKRALQKDPEVYKKYLALPDLYRRVRVDTIQFCLVIRQPDVFKSRLKKFVENTGQGKMYGNWHDDGRLLDY